MSLEIVKERIVANISNYKMMIAEQKNTIIVLISFRFYEQFRIS